VNKRDGKRPRYISKAPPPPVTLSGARHIWPSPNPINIPANCWPGCPALELAAQTILAETAGELVTRNRLPEACTRIVAGLGPHIAKAIESGNLARDVAISHGGILRLLRSLLAYNGYGSPVGGLNSEGWAILQGVKRSAEWRGLLKSVTEVQDGPNSHQVPDAPPKAEATAAGKLNPGVGERRIIVKNNPTMSAEELCRRFDYHSLALPGNWNEKLGVTDWRSAYRDAKLKPLIQAMLSKDKAHNKQ
jgi:hypothetical protein